MTTTEWESVRTLLVSDVHLGSKYSQSAEFLKFLRRFRPDKLYIVGDFIDGWKFASGWTWNQHCDDVIEHLLQLARRGTEICYVPGNHDSFLRNKAFRTMLPQELAGIQIQHDFVHEMHNGWRFLVTHGDSFDFFETKAQWISKASSCFYDACLSLNWWLHRWTMTEQHNPYGVCRMLKHRVKRGIQFISDFEHKLTDYAHTRGCQGVICGHIHTPDIVYKPGSLVYCNTGDWMENCTGLVEHHDGEIRLIGRYQDSRTLRLPVRAVESADGETPLACELESEPTSPTNAEADSNQDRLPEFAA
ncbi:UDP-2,3-diacylglucosamine diphosphatase [Roseimaritima ulvae]|uniref:UDP-2,3-diacylglucosamine hydrolase n=1 Tax=Roseimaritima ulvae TaxID=980254 RepID=A0A5B9QX62_9BACT|nr:UDP-2,3-diacylglucosamine diphosphatase [Roseimaritima ulvae]QEG41706.1 UDP-2,3-diacylglucosamine hydrolase [Roseimaritima ulvae]